jgi:hypothetical protein
MNLMGNGGPSDLYTPFVRITNSYNGTRALRVDVGFLREHCSNGVIFEQEAANLTVPHTRQGIHSLKVARPFDGMGELREKFCATLADIRGVAIEPEDARQLVRAVIGWPKLPEKPKDWETSDQSTLDADLTSRLRGYFQELGGNAYAAFNTMTDLAARPPQSPRFRRDLPTLERRAGAWLPSMPRRRTGSSSRRSPSICQRSSTCHVPGRVEPWNHLIESGRMHTGAPSLPLPLASEKPGLPRSMFWQPEDYLIGNLAS